VLNYSTKREYVPMRTWEYKLYRAYDRSFYGVIDFFEMLYKRLKLTLQRFLPKYEYFIDYATNTVKKRIAGGTGSKMGTYQFMNGKIVKVAGYIPALKESLPWSEVNAGYYDEELGAHIENKDHYRRLMKEKGLVAMSHEDTRYQPRAEIRRKKAWEQMQAKNAKRDRERFQATVSRVEAEIGRLDSW